MITSFSSFPSFLYSLMVQNLFSGDSPQSLFNSLNIRSVMTSSSSFPSMMDKLSFLNTSCWAVIKILNCYLFSTEVFVDDHSIRSDFQYLPIKIHEVFAFSLRKSLCIFICIRLIIHEMENCFISLQIDALLRIGTVRVDYGRRETQHKIGTRLSRDLYRFLLRGSRLASYRFA